MLVSALIYGGSAAKVLQHVVSSQTLILSDYIVDELVAYLKVARPKIAQKWIRGLRESLSQYCHEYDHDLPIGSRDPKDDPIISLALAHNACIITGDRDIIEHATSIKLTVLRVGEYAELFYCNRAG